MDDLLPIVPGCLCVVIKGMRVGTEVTAIRRVCMSSIPIPPGYKQFPKGPGWEVDKDMPFAPINKRDLLRIDRFFAPYRSEDYLMRIDGHQPDEQDSQTTDSPKEKTHS